MASTPHMEMLFKINIETYAREKNEYYAEIKYGACQTRGGKGEEGRGTLMVNETVDEATDSICNKYLKVDKLTSILR